MNIIERGRQFVQRLLALTQRTAREWRVCPHCGSTLTTKYGTYCRHPWTLDGRRVRRVQRHRCLTCRKTYSETTADLTRRRWYARAVRRAAIDGCLHLRSSLRRVAEDLRSRLGHQERWLLWHGLSASVGPDDRLACHLHASTVSRWLAEAGEHARQTIPDQLAGIPTSGQFATDGLWVRLRQGTKRVVLLLVDSVTGVCWPPVVAREETKATSWQPLFERAHQAGLDTARTLRGLASDGAAGLEAYRRRHLPWVSHQRCIFHLWRGLGGAVAQAAQAVSGDLAGAVAQAARHAVRRDLAMLVRAVLDAASAVAAEAALGPLTAHPHGGAIARLLAPHLEAAHVHRCGYNRGLGRASPEWCWRDYRQRLSRGRNQGTDQGLEQDALLRALYRNFEPAQSRSERHRRYRHPGRCPLAVAGVPPGDISYLDALGI